MHQSKYKHVKTYILLPPETKTEDLLTVKPDKTQIMKSVLFPVAATIILSVGICSCEPARTIASQADSKYISQPLVTHIYTADPSAHVFNGRIYIYPSHDTATGIP